MNAKECVAVLGRSGSGKTTFFSVLSLAFHRRYPEEYNFTPMAAGMAYVTANRLKLESGEWLDPTGEKNWFVYRATLTWKRWGRTQSRDILLTDMSGEAIRKLLGWQADGQAPPPFYGPLVSTLISAGGFILLINGTADTLEMKSSEIDHIHFLTEVFSSAKLKPGRQRLRRPIAVVFTRFDALSKDQRRTPADVYARHAIEELHGWLQKNVVLGFVHYFYCSSVGGTTLTANGDGTRKPMKPIRPFQVAEVVAWAAEKVEP